MAYEKPYSNIVSGRAPTQNGSPAGESVEMKKPNGLTNGSGSLTESYENSMAIQQSKNSTASMSFSAEHQNTILRDSITITRRKLIAEMDDVDESSIQRATIEDFLECIERQRLTHMPHKGSTWDKVLKWAEFFALQISGYVTAVRSVVPDSKTAAQLIWAASQSLLNLGPDNAEALETTFGSFYRLGLSISVLLRNNLLLSATGQIRSETGQILNSLLVLVRDVSLYYGMRLRSSNHDVSIDFSTLYGGQIAAFHQRKNYIIDAMWEHSLGDEAAMEVRTLRKRLGPQDSGLQRLLESDDIGPSERGEYTCEWFQSHLLAFSRSKDDTLVLSGPIGCGKSVLSGWIAERLQRPLGRKVYNILTCTIEADVPSEATSLAIVKRLLQQKLEISVGHKKLHTDLVKSFHTAADKHPDELEKSLWHCFESGMSHSQDTVHSMILVDGLDHIQGGEKAAKATMNRLATLAVKHSNVQVITTSRSNSLKPDKGKTKSFAITPDHTHQDLGMVINQCFASNKYFSSRSEHAQEHLVDQLVHAARGNFLWAILYAMLLKHEASEEVFNKAVKAAKDAPLSLDEVISKLFGHVDLSNTDNGNLVAMMLVADRPLRAVELVQLLQIDVLRKKSVERGTDIAQDLKNAMGPLLLVQNQFIRFRHQAVKLYLQKVQEEGKKLCNRQATHNEMVRRLLIYCTFNLPRTSDPTLHQLSQSDVEKCFSSYVLMEYAVRHWTMHFRSSTMCQDNEIHSLDDDFKAIFPSTIQFSVLEWACWETESFRPTATAVLEFGLRVRKAAFPDPNISVLQSLIICGTMWRNATRTNEAADCFYEASTIGQRLPTKFHSVITACTTTFLTIIESNTFTTRTELATRKEKMLLYTIELYRSQHGKTHDLVIRYSQSLANLYIDIHEEHKAESLLRALREVMIMRFGKGSQDETKISENLTIVLKKGDTKTNVVEYERGIFDIMTELEVFNIKRIRLTIELAMSYENRGEFLMAEELFVYLWRRLTEECHKPHHRQGVEIHIHLLDVVIEYVRFLRRCHRHEEGSSVLLCIWTEYEEYDFESENIFLRLKIIGELMRSVSLLSAAVAVLKKCLSWFKSRSLHEQITSCETLVFETVKEITTVTTTTNSTTTTFSETVMKETFESTLSRSVVTSETISVCQGLVAHYMKLEQWSSVIEVTRRSLSLIWKSVITGRGTVALPRDFSAGAIDIAISLAISHQRSYHYHEAEETYGRIYRACRNSCHIDDERLGRASKVLIRFYEEHRHWYQVIEIYKELLAEYRSHLGAKHHQTIQTLYILGALCVEHADVDALQYYEEIATLLNQDSTVCHVDALEAMIFICRYHLEAGHWHKLQTVCKTLWNSWRDHHRSHAKFTMEIVEQLHFRYSYVLEHHLHCEYSVLRELAIEYRSTCLQVFGAEAVITVKATIELAHINMRSEKHIHEAITIYEEIITHTKKVKTTGISTTTITSIKQRLTNAYVTLCSHEDVSTTVIESALKVVVERYDYLRLTYGWQSDTLACLREVVLLHVKAKQQAVVVRLLLAASIQITTKETKSQSLYECGRTIGQIFDQCGMGNQALEILQELRLQIITGKASEHNKHGVKAEKSPGTLCFVFLVTLEQVVRGAQSVSYSEVMADYLTESILYKSYQQSLNSSAIVVIGHAARLRSFLSRHKRHGQREVLEKQSYEVFVKNWTINPKSREGGLLFYVSLLAQIGDTIRDVQIGDVACLASVAEVRSLLESGHVQKAYDIAEVAFDFIEQQRCYHHLQNVPAGFRLSALLAGRGLDHAVFAKIDQKLQENMLELSRKIIRGVLKACKHSKVDFVRLELKELNELVGLLGKQQNHAELEWILELLWKSREVQKNWKPDTIIAVGRAFVQARYLNASKERKSEAIRLCEDICYNMRRTWGALDPKTLEMSDLLSQLYTNMGHYREAQDLHESILRLIVEGDDGDDRTLDTAHSENALQQVTLLKQSFLRLHGWNKSVDTYVDIVRELKSMPEYKSEKQWKQLALPSEWNSKETPSETLGAFIAPGEWGLVRAEDVGRDGSIRETPTGPKRGMKRATSNWGLGLFHHFAHGDHDHGRSNGASNGNGRIAGKKFGAMDGEGGYASAEE